ncbi:MAG: hypothetical protein II664_06750 [Oscillospiraceae bacterium]|nr:hypothetical protein [Oscillospiraceae bacterium]
MSELTVSRREIPSPLLHSFGLNLRDRLSAMLMSFVLYLLGAPTVMIVLMADIRRGFTADNYTYIYNVVLFFMIGICCTGAAAVMGLVFTAGIYKGLYDKSTCDMQAALPMNTKERFLSDYLSGLSVLLLPYLAAQTVSVILLFVGRTAFDNSGPSELTGMPEHIFAVLTVPFIELVIGGLVVMVMLYTAMVLSAQCCGRLSTTLIMGTVFCVLPFAAVKLFAADMDDILYGTPDIRNAIERISGAMFPAGAVYGLADCSAEMLQKAYDPDYAASFFSGYEAYTSFAQWLIPAVIVTIALFAAAYIRAFRVKAEKIGSPVTSDVFWFVITSEISICFLLASRLFEHEFSRRFVALQGIVVFAAAVFIMRKKRKAAVVGGICSAAVIATVMIAVTAAESTGFFGKVYYVPDASEVASVDTDYRGFFSEDGDVRITLSDPENIARITAAHTSQLESFRASQNDPDIMYTSGRFDNVPFCVEYKLKDGRTVRRTYESLQTDAHMQLRGIDTSDEYKHIFTERMSRYFDELSRREENFYKAKELYPDKYAARRSTGSESGYMLDLIGISVGRNTWASYLSALSNGGSVYDELPDKDFVRKLGECLCADYAEMTEKEFYEPIVPECAVITLRYREPANYYRTLETINVPGCFVRTAELLERNGFLTEDDTAVSSGESAVTRTVTFMEYKGAPLSYRADDRYCKGRAEVKVTEENAEEIDRLLRSAVMDTVIDGDYYTVESDRYRYAFIPKDMSGEVAELIENYGESGEPPLA